MRLRSCLVLLLLLGLPTRALAAVERTARPVLRAQRLDRPVSVDGVLDDDAWRVAPVTGFTQSYPDEGAAPRQRTEAWIAYDDDALYVAARLHDSAPDSIVARLARRDTDKGSDAFALRLDPFHDGRTGYFFIVNAAGAFKDGTIFNDGNEDASWDGVWAAHVRRDAGGWSVEMRIPLSQLRFRSDTDPVWGINLVREIGRHTESDAITWTPRGESGVVSRFAELRGLDGLRSARHLELTPYLTTRSERLSHDGGAPFDPADPFHGDWRSSPAVGADLRAGLGSRLTLNATVNPDFGQVEVDPAVVNLTDVESFFMEKRPFFTEGAGVFRCGNNGANDYPGFNWPEPAFLYSRRIGRAPRGSAPSADYVDQPIATRILGAAKVTGQVRPGWDIGTVQSVTQREEANLSTNGLETRAGVEPAAWYGVFRTLNALEGGKRGLGLMVTGTERFYDGAADPLRDETNASAWVGTADGWAFLDDQRVWVLSGWASASRVQGSNARITALQGSFPHYRQRPDRPDLGIDPDATSMAGWGSRLWLNKQEGRLLFNAALGAISPDYDNNDLGFLSGADIVNSHVMGGWKWETPGRFKQSAFLYGATAMSWDFGGNHTMRMFYLGGDIEQRNHRTWHGSIVRRERTLDSRVTRGGPVRVAPAHWNAEGYFDTNGRAPWFWSIALNGTWGEDGSWKQSVKPGFKWRPRSQAAIEGGVEWQRSHTDAQFWDNAGTLATGSRFAALEQTQWSTSLRLDYSVTPALTLQFFAQPLAVSLDYHDLRELARSRSYEFLPAGEIGPDEDRSGTFGTLRGNAVVRWEYAPGSALYLVWTQERTGDDPTSEFEFDRGYRVVSRAPANHVLLVKLAHHFDL